LGLAAPRRDHVGAGSQARAPTLEQGAHGPALLEAAQGSAVQSEYNANTQAAIDQGVFGLPTFAIDDELFWGQDRLDFVARALA
jgi:2-hydroxychromene-2-carboxylate isomerase